MSCKNICHNLYSRHEQPIHVKRSVKLIFTQALMIWLVKTVTLCKKIFHILKFYIFHVKFKTFLLRKLKKNLFA